MKILFIYTFLILSLFGDSYQYSETSYGNGEELKIKKFNFSSDVILNGDIESRLDHKTKRKVYLIPMKNSNDQLLAYKGDNSPDLTPIVFINLDGSEVVYKDVNNRKKVLTLSLLENDEIEEFEYFDKNDSKSGYALTAAGCMGGSTIGCIKMALIACDQDYECSLYCRATGWRCPIAIAIACAIHCNK